MLFLSANEIRPIGLVDFPQFPLSLDIGAVHLLCPASAQVPAPAAALGLWFRANGRVCWFRMQQGKGAG